MQAVQGMQAVQKGAETAKVQTGEKGARGCTYGGYVEEMLEGRTPLEGSTGECSPTGK